MSAPQTPLPRLWVWRTIDPNYACSPDRHVFEDLGYTFAPPSDARCVCGQTTWDEEVQAAWKRFEARTNRSQLALDTTEKENA